MILLQKPEPLFQRHIKFQIVKKINFIWLVILCSATLFSGSLNAQETKIWTLEECIDYALNHNINIQKQMLGIDYREELLLQSKLNILPSVNGYASHSYNWGQRIDPYTNEFASERVRSNNLYLQGDLNLFSGLQQLNTIKRNMLDLKASQFDADYYKDNISITVATEYLQTLYYLEYVTIAENQLSITRQQVDRTKKLVDAGTLAKGDLLTIEAQLASEELILVEAQNNLSLSYLNLTQLLELPTTKGFEIERPELGLITEPDRSTPEQIFGVASSNRPEIKSAETKLESSEKSLSIAKGSYYPSLSLSGSLGSGYSGANKIGENLMLEDPIEIGYTEFSNEKVFTQTYGYESFKTKSFSDQFDENRNEYLGLSLRIPIFNGWSSRSNVAQAKINVANASLDLQLQKNTLYKIIQQSYNDALAASNKNQAAEKKVNATRESYNYAEQKFNLGLINSVDYNNAKKEYNNAQSELIQAKYDFVFKITVIDFYLGKPLSLKR
jgi:outer membrane protein